MREHDAGDVIGVLARRGGPAETDRRLRHVEIDDLDARQAGERRFGDGLKIAARRQIGEGRVDQGGRALFVDRADDGKMERAARDQPGREALQVVAFDRREAFQRSLRRQAVGVAGKDARAPGPPGPRRRVVGLAPELRVHLLAHARERRLVETRRVEGEAQQFAGAVEIALQRAHPPAEVIVFGLERNFDRLFFERVLERLAVEIARAFVEQAREQRRRARLALGVLRRAAAKSEFERHQRNRVVLDQPEANAARRDELRTLTALGRAD